MQRLARVATDIDVPRAQRAGAERHPRRPLPPLGMEDRFVLLGAHGAEAHHAAEILRAVHAAPPGARARPVPIIESRVTRSASRASLQPSVPAGRIGTTR